MLIADHRSLEEGGESHQLYGGLLGGSEEKGSSVSPGGWGGFSRAGDGGRSEWGYQVEGPAQSKGRGVGMVSHTEGMARVTHGAGCGEWGRDGIWQERKVGPQGGNSHS